MVASCPSTCRAKVAADKRVEDAARVLDELEAQVYGLPPPLPRCLAASAEVPAPPTPAPELITLPAPGGVLATALGLGPPPIPQAAPLKDVPMGPIKLRTPMVILAILICGVLFTSVRYITWRLRQQRKQKRFESYLRAAELQNLLTKSKVPRASRDRKRKGGGGLNVVEVSQPSRENVIHRAHFLLINTILSVVAFYHGWCSRLGCAVSDMRRPMSFPNLISFLGSMRDSIYTLSPSRSQELAPCPPTPATPLTSGARQASATGTPASNTRFTELSRSSTIDTIPKATPPAPSFTPSRCVVTSLYITAQPSPVIRATGTQSCLELPGVGIQTECRLQDVGTSTTPVNQRAYGRVPAVMVQKYPERAVEVGVQTEDEEAEVLLEAIFSASLWKDVDEGSGTWPPPLDSARMDDLGPPPGFEHVVDPG